MFLKRDAETDFKPDRTGCLLMDFSGKAHVGLLFVSPSKRSQIFAPRLVPFATGAAEDR